MRADTGTVMDGMDAMDTMDKMDGRDGETLVLVEMQCHPFDVNTDCQCDLAAEILTIPGNFFRIR